MFVLGHSVRWIDGHPIIDFDIVGTTGNIYKVTVGKVPFCSCPDSQKGNQCKHVCYGTFLSSNTIIMPSLFFGIFISILIDIMAYQVLVNALKAPAHLQYQLAFLSTVSYHSTSCFLAQDAD